MVIVLLGKHAHTLAAVENFCSHVSQIFNQEALDKLTFGLIMAKQ